LDILNLDEMAVEQELQEKQKELEEAEADEEEEEEGDDEMEIHHHSSHPFRENKTLPKGIDERKDTSLNHINHEFEDFSTSSTPLRVVHDQEQETYNFTAENNLVGIPDETEVSDSSPYKQFPSFDVNLSQHEVTFESSDEDEVPQNKEIYQNEDPVLPQQSIPGELPDMSPTQSGGNVSSSTSKKKHPIFGNVSVKEKTATKELISFGSPVAAVAPIRAVPASVTNQVNLEPTVASTETKKTKKKKKSNKKTTDKKKKGLNFFGFSAKPQGEEEEEENEGKRDVDQLGSLRQVESKSKGKKQEAYHEGGSAGFGLSSLWDDGIAGGPSDDILFPLPTSSSASSSSSSSSGSSSSILRLSNDIINNLSKRVSGSQSSYFDNLENDLELADDPILKQVEWNKQNPHALRAGTSGKQGSGWNYLSFFPSSSSAETAASSSSTSSSVTLSSSSGNTGLSESSSSAFSSSMNTSSISFSSLYTSHCSPCVTSLSSTWSDLQKEVKNMISSFSYWKCLHCCYLLFLLFCFLLLSLLLLFVVFCKVVLIKVFGPRIVSYCELNEVRFSLVDVVFGLTLPAVVYRVKEIS
jgi:hypothetical protein